MLCVSAEFFPGFKLWADVFYLSATCDELTEEQQTEVNRQPFCDINFNQSQFNVNCSRYQNVHV